MDRWKIDKTTYPPFFNAGASSKIQRMNKQNQNQKQQQQHQPNFRAPLHEFNVISNTRSSDISSMPIEAPRGCLRFFLSSQASSSYIKPNQALKTTPKSAPNLRLAKTYTPNQPKENLPKRSIEEGNQPKFGTQEPNAKKHYRNISPCLYQWQRRKKPSSKGIAKPKTSYFSAASVSSSLCKLASGTKELEVRMVDSEGLFTLPKSSIDEVNSIPLSKIDKVAEEENSETSSRTKTPPIEASVSPEIQCGSSMVSTTTTPACYGAGYLVSGVTDKRKCRARGMLTVGEIDLGIHKLESFDSLHNENGDEEHILGLTGSGNSAAVSVVSSPIEASMNWLLSPCNEEDKIRSGNCDNTTHPSESFTGSITLHSPTSSISFDSNSRRKKSLISPDEQPRFQALLEPSLVEMPVLFSPECKPSCPEIVNFKEGRKQYYDLNGENSPFSMDSQGSSNVMRTPQSDSSSDSLVGLSWLHSNASKIHEFNFELTSAAELLEMESLSPRSHKKLSSIRDEDDLSFQFDLLTTSNSADLFQFRKVLDDRSSWHSNMSQSQSQTRISWREGLMSQIYEMDEYDCCRCLSEEEDEGQDMNGCDISLLLETHQSPQVNTTVVGHSRIVTKDCGSTEFDNDVAAQEKEVKEGFLPHQTLCASAESISTDGGGLIASGDSDWNLCYKNRLFDL